MDNAEVSQNVILAVIAAPLLSAFVDLIKRTGPPWLRDGMTPALVAELMGIGLGILAHVLVTPLYSIPGQPLVFPTAPLANYIAGGFVMGLSAVGLHAQYRAATNTQPKPSNDAEEA